MTARTHHAPGAPLPTLTPGDVVLTHSRWWTGRLIRFGQALRFRGRRRRFAHWSHAALAVGPAHIAEARGNGVVDRPLAEYADTEFVVIQHAVADMRDRAQVLAFADAVLAARWRYDYAEILALAVTLLTGSKWVVGRIGTAICSGFVGEALTRAGYIFDRPPAYLMPADLAEHFDVA